MNLTEAKLPTRFYGLLTIPLSCCVFCYGSLKASVIDCEHPPIAVEAVAPVYAGMAGRASISGEIKVMATIDDAGNVVSVHLIDDDIPESILRRNLMVGFDSSAINAAKKWHFNPSIACGSRYAVLTFNFQISETVNETVFRPPYLIDIRFKRRIIMLNSNETLNRHIYHSDRLYERHIFHPIFYPNLLLSHG